MKTDPHYIGLLHKELTRQLSAQEAEGLKDWLDQHEHHRQIRQEVRHSWELAGTPLPEPGQEEIEAELSRLQQRIGLESRQESRLEARPTTDLRQFRRQAAYLLAAMVLILALAFGGLLVSRRGEVPQGASAFYSTAPTAQQQKFSLPDRSTVHTRGATELTYLESEGARNLRFSGQAFFEVARQEHHPFMIYAEGMQIQVLGTSFFVKAQAGEPLEIGVASGQVAVDYQGVQHLLSGGEWIRFVPGERARVQPNEDPNYFSWYSGRLEFQQSPLREVLPALERHYDIRLEASTPALLNCRFTGSFEQIALDELLEIISYSLGVSVDTLDNRTFRLSGEGCS